MRVLMDQQSYDELLARDNHTSDCYVRPGQYLHHLYRNGIKFVVARSLYACLSEAKQQDDPEALAHLGLHEAELRALVTATKAAGTFDLTRPLGDAVPVEQPTQAPRESFTPDLPISWEQTGLNR
jgi:hypothetical protein